LTGLIELRARVALDEELPAVEIQVAAVNSLGFCKTTVLLNCEAALDLAMRLIGTAARLRRIETGSA
jgi:hypothetical protein